MKYLLIIALGAAACSPYADRDRSIQTIAELQSGNALLLNRIEAMINQLSGMTKEIEEIRDRAARCDVAVTTLRSVITHMQEEEDQRPRTPIFGKD